MSAVVGQLETMAGGIETQLAELNELIRQSHVYPNDDAIQQRALEKSLAYVQKHIGEHHLFCDKSMHSVSVHILILFSFGDNEPLQWFKEEISKSLNTCSKCAYFFHRGRVNLKETFIVKRGVKRASVEQFSDIILSWEAERLVERLTTFDSAYAFARSQDSNAPVPMELLFGIAECFCGPGMLRLNSALRQIFDKILYSLLASDHPFVEKSKIVTPGLIFLLFEGQEVQRNWAVKQFAALYNPDALFTEAQVYSDVLEEYLVHFLNVQNPDKFSNKNCALFYKNMFIILRLYDKDAIINKFSSPIDFEILKDSVEFSVQPLFKLLQQHIMGYLEDPLPHILRFFNMILAKSGETYWSQVAPYTFQNILETITGNPHYLGNLSRLEHTTQPEAGVDSKANLSDLLDWIDEFLKTLETAKQQTTYNRLSLFFITLVESQNTLTLQTKAILFKKACSMTIAALTIPSKLYGPSFKSDLLLRSDSKMVVNTKLERFMDYATSRAIFYPEKERTANGEVCKLAVSVIAKALRFDVLNLAQGTYDIHNGKATSSLKFSSVMFQLILKQNFGTQLELAYQLLISLENVSNIIPLTGSQKEEATEFLKFVRQFFVKLSDIDTRNIKMILSNSRSLKGYWATVFSSTTDVYQSAIDILYETFDADGRLEGVHSLLDNNLHACVSAINDNLTNLIFFKSFEPCPRAVRVLIDVLSALNSPINGIFGKSDMFTDGVKETLKLFWNRCWSFLDLIYVQTPIWANKYPDLVEFTRDTLDLSHAVLKCFHKINEFFKGDDATKRTFVEITNTFPDMLVWLRLSDPGLLSSCVNLISSTVDLANQFNLSLDKNVISLLAKYGSRAKKFNNKLTDQQSDEILMRAKVFDKALVDSIFQEAENYRKSKLQSSAVTSSESTPQLPSSERRDNDIDSDEVELISSSKIAPSRANQLKIDRFGSLSRVPPKVQAKAKLPPSALEKARAELKARTIHPPGQPGFNPRRNLKRGEDDSSDDDNENDDDDIHGLFGLKKPKQNAGITILGDNLKKPRILTVNEQQREEEYSRKRLNVDLKPLYRKILKWSFKRDDEYPESEYRELKPVADEFKSAADYINTYEPLLLLECWQAILSAKTRQPDKPMLITIGSKSTVDDFFEVYFSSTKTEIQEKKLSDSDLVVLAVSEKPINPGQSFEPKFRDVKESNLSCLGKLHEIKHVKGDRVDVTVRVTRSANVNNFLTPQSTVIMMRVMQMTTIEREYSSLFGLQYYNLSKQIFEAKADISSKCDESELSKIQKIYKVNESQARAIGVSFNTSGFTLIQGPPGTGKTKTIIGIIGYMLTSFHNANAIVVPTTNGKPDASADKKRKILVCAPSNAAVDELVLRLKDGVMNSRGDKYTPQLVRLGRTDAINTAVKDMTLEELVDAQLGRTTPVTNNMEKNNRELAALQKQIAECKAKIDDQEKPAGDEVYKLRRQLIQQANVIKMKKDQEREAINTQYRNREINRRNIQSKILAGAEIICATLSGSAHDMVANMGIKFDSVIIDEACQCTELSAVIPLRYGCNRCIMVGDPNQLPPTVLSGAAADSGYDQSLFVRMAKTSKPLLLDVQYRMNSAISRFPSRKFYDGALKDGEENDKLTERPWHESPVLPPYTFYDIVEGRQSQNSKTLSYTNKMEVNIAIELIHKLLRDYRRYDFRNKIGIITPYKEQNRLLQNEFNREFGRSINNEISFNTIDGFQGQEKEIIIMSCVRADPLKGGIGFLKDFRRMNVALTRPKCSLWILGNHDSLVKNRLWGDLITDAKDRGLLVEARSGFTRGGSGPQSVNQAPTHSHEATDIGSNAVNTTSDDKQSKKKARKKNKKGNLNSNAAANSTTAANPSTTPTAPSRSGSLPAPQNSGNNQTKEQETNHPASAQQEHQHSQVKIPYHPSQLNTILYQPSQTHTLPRPTIPNGPNPTRSGNLPSGPATGQNAPNLPPNVPSGPSSANLPVGPSATRTGSLPPRPGAPPTGPSEMKKRRPKETSIFIQPKKKKKPF